MSKNIIGTGVCEICCGVTIQKEDEVTTLYEEMCHTCGTTRSQVVDEETGEVDWVVKETKSTLHLYEKGKGYTVSCFHHDTTAAFLRFLVKQMSSGDYDVDKSFYNYQRDGIWVRLTGRDVIVESEGLMAGTEDALKWFEVMVAGMDVESPDTYTQRKGAYRRAIHALKNCLKEAGETRRA